MNKALINCLTEYRNQIYLLIRHYLDMKKSFLLRSDVIDGFYEFCKANNTEELLDSPLSDLIKHVQEAALENPWLYFAVRPKVARWEYIRFHIKQIDIEEISSTEYLKFKERIVNKNDDHFHLEIDLEPFNRRFPKLKKVQSIGRGVRFLNLQLCRKLFQEEDRGYKLLLDFLKSHHKKDTQLMLNNTIQDLEQLQKALGQAEEFLCSCPKNTEWDELSIKMSTLGFEAGWGRTAEQILFNINLLSDILEAPDPVKIELFLGKIPMIFNIVILSPHGYFSQDDVFGFPDTGGQVVYILDQVCALEKELKQRLYEQGLDIKPRIIIVTRLIPESRGTSCNQRTEKIIGTDDAYIYRIPFRDENGEIVNDWISRFKLWAYLERFTLEVEREILSELQDKPDLIIGNYSDGNLVASLLSRRLKVIQGMIAHVFEKNKYLFSDLYWKDYEKDYHFSCQFTADLIAMSTADFLITSTYQEIKGSEERMGQYETFHSYTMPDLYRVVNGINIFDPKFNVISPGVDENIFFPYTETKKRLTALHSQMENLIFGKPEPGKYRGCLLDNKKPIIFTMARLDKLKNITNCVEWYAKNNKLRTLANFFIIGGYIDPDLSKDMEEREEIKRMHEIMDEYKLDDIVRWIPAQTDKIFVGELYRYIADFKGLFVQPSLFEGFGLTVVESMISGLPIFATCYGGPFEIVEDGVSGFHINPIYGEETANAMTDFLEKCKKKPDYWHKISKQGIERIKSRYTWTLYADQLITITQVYAFWRYVTNLDRDETIRYIEMLYNLLFRKLAKEI